MAIVRIRHKGLRELFETGRSSRVAPALQSRAIAIMDLLDAAAGPDDCRGAHDFHPLKGDRKGEYSMHVNGPWCVTFRWDGPDVVINDLENYHGDD